MSQRWLLRLTGLVAGLLLSSASPADSAALAAPADSSTPAAPAAGPVVGAYRSPLPDLVVLRPFDRSVTTYGPGHRGVDLAAAAAAEVRAAAAGAVSFAGPVAGRGVVVILHPDGIRTTYEPVTPAVVTGQAVAAGQVIGTVTGQHEGCATSCLHWGARRGDVYLDPLDLLRRLGPIRLIP